MSRRPLLVVLMLAAGLVLLALRSAFAYDFHAFRELDGFEASRWTWLLVVAAAGLAGVGLFVRRDLVRWSSAAGLIATASLAIALVATVAATPGRAERASSTLDCSNQNIGVVCRFHEALDALAPPPPPAAPSRIFVIAALAALALVSGRALLARRP